MAQAAGFKKQYPSNIITEEDGWGGLLPLPGGFFWGSLQEVSWKALIRVRYTVSCILRLVHKLLSAYDGKKIIKTYIYAGFPGLRDKKKNVQ